MQSKDKRDPQFLTCELGKKFLELEPWDFLYESDVFGIEIPGEETYFISVMGSNEEFFGISAYKGSYNLGIFWEMQREDIKLAPETFLTLDQFMFSFKDKTELSKEDISKIESTGIKFKNGLLPVLEEIIPGYIPGKVTDENAGLPLEIFQQVFAVCEQAKKDQDFIHPEDHDDDMYLIRKKEDNEWKNTYQSIPIDAVRFDITCDNSIIKQVQNLKKKPEVFQVDLVLLPAPVKEKDIPPFFPFMLMMVNKKTEIVEFMKIIEPVPDYKSMLENVPALFLDAIIEKGFRPFKMEIRPGVIFSILSLITGKIGIEAKEVSNLTALDMAKVSLYDSLENQ